MTLTTYETLTQGSEEWHTVRRGIVTASTVGKLVTPSRRVADNDTSRGLTATLIAERITGVTEENRITHDMWRGIFAEPVARDLYAKHYAPVDVMGFMRLDATWGTLGYSPDGLVGNDGLIEIKAPRAHTHLRTLLADEVPAHYEAQCQSGLLVSGRKWIDFVSYHGGMPLFVKRVYADDVMQQAIRDAVAAFEDNAKYELGRYQLAIKGRPETTRIDFDLEVI